MAIIFESIFEIKDGECAEQNMHKDIREYALSKDPCAKESLDRIDEEISKMKARGFELVYSMKFNPGFFNTEH